MEFPPSPSDLEPSDPSEPWRLLHFKERIQAWVDDRSPSDEIRDRVIRWVVVDLARNPMQVNSIPLGEGFPMEYRFVRVPFTAENGEEIGCSFLLRRGDRSIQCLTFDQVRDL